MKTLASLTSATTADEAAAWFFDNSLDVFLVSKDGLIQAISPSWTALTGWSAAETIGRRTGEFVHADDLELRAQATRTVVADGVVTFEHRVLVKFGGVLWVRSRVKRTADATDLTVIQDITEERRRSAEADEVARAAALLRASAGVSLWRYHPDLDQFEHDPDFSRPFVETGPARRMSTKAMYAAVHADDVDALRAVFDRTAATGELGRAEFRRKRSGRDWRRMRGACSGSRQLASGRWEVLLVIQDLTELMAERDLAKIAAHAKSRFLANVGHEIRTPMNGVLGMLRGLKAPMPKSRRDRLLDAAIASGSALSQLLGDIVAFSEIEAGRFDIQRTSTDIAQLVEAVAVLLRDQAAAKSLTLGVTCADIGWLSVDPARVRQILFQLIGNAIKFTARGGVMVTALATGEGDARRLRIEVEDTGAGVSEGDAERIFEPFRQADDSNTRGFGGAGLGLAIARPLARLLGGDVGCRRRAGEGSVFWLDIAAPASEPAAPPRSDSGRWLAGLRVLVVEDNPTNQLVAKQMLTHLGARVTTATDGARGLAAASRRAFDLIFMDIQMPVMDGMEATRRIRALKPPFGSAPIVALTANVLGHQLDSYRRVGMDGCVAKPVSPAALIAEISRLAGDVRPGTPATLNA